MRVYAIIVAAALVACGKEEGKGKDAKTELAAPTAAPAAHPKDEDEQTFAVADAKRLPECNAAREGALAYVRSDKRFRVCEGGQWAEAAVGAAGVEVADEAAGANCPAGGERITTFVDEDGDGARGASEKATGPTRFVCAGASGAKGDKGEKGDVGAKGADGAAGVDGTDNRVVAVYACKATTYSARFYAGISSSFYTDYKVTLTAAGDVTATALFGWPDQGGSNLGGETSSYVRTYAAGEADAATAKLVVFGQNMVLAGSGTQHQGTWTWTLDRDAETVAVSYYDPDLTAPQTINWTIPCTVTAE